MNPNDYTFLLSHPEAVNERQTDALERIITEFPYFQSARALRLKGLYNQNSFQYNYALKVTAAYTTDRSVLFDFITSDSFTAIQRGLYQEKLAEIGNIDVNESFVLPDAEKAERKTDTELIEQSILTSIREAENQVEVSADEVETATETAAAHEINAEDFGPIHEEPEFLPEAIAPIEFVPIESVAVPDEPTVAEVKAAEHEPPTALEHVDIDDEPDAEEPVAEIAEIKTEPAAETENTVDVNEQAMQRLDIGKPLEFSKDETHSFAEWLQLSSLRPIVRDEAPAEDVVEKAQEILGV